MKAQERQDWMVCVGCITFNQAQYIVEAMDGFCMQETNFPFVCTIVDDCSTDGEKDIIKHYLNDHFERVPQSVVSLDNTEDFQFTYARHKTNPNCYFAVYFLKYNHYSIKKPKRSYFDLWTKGSKYFAFCEGDDYWINARKLQMQVDYMENTPKCIYLFTARYIKNEVNQSCRLQRYEKRSYKQSDVLSGFNPGLQNSLFATKVRTILNDKINNFKGINGDRLYPYIASTLGEIHYLDAVTSVYRITGKGISTSVRSDQWFSHAAKDFYHFHKTVNANDKLSYIKGMTNYIRSFYKNRGKRVLIFPISNLYRELKQINPTVTWFDCTCMLLYWIKRKIDVKLNRFYLKESQVPFSNLVEQLFLS